MDKGEVTFLVSTIDDVFVIIIIIIIHPQRVGGKCVELLASAFYDFI